jgi:transglutaminase-like putative cysteine protease
VKYRIERVQRVRFDASVREHHFQCRVAPWDGSGQRLLALAVSAEPEAEFASHRDGFGNEVHRSALLGAHDALTLRMSADVETLLANPFEFESITPARERDWIDDSLRQAPRLWDFVLHRSALTPALDPDGAARLFGEDADCPEWRAGQPVLAQVQDAACWVQSRFGLDCEDTASADSLRELVLRGAGTDVDLAHLLVAIIRSWGIPARFVRGYMDAAYFEPDDEDPPDTPARPQQLHSWAEVLVPGAGWRGFDPGQGLLADDTYIRVAVGRDVADIADFRQSFKGKGDVDALEIDIDVQRLD